MYVSESNSITYQYIHTYTHVCHRYMNEKLHAARSPLFLTYYNLVPSLARFQCAKDLLKIISIYLKIKN